MHQPNCSCCPLHVSQLALVSEPACVPPYSHSVTAGKHRPPLSRQAVSSRWVCSMIQSEHRHKADLGSKLKRPTDEAALDQKMMHAQHYSTTVPGQNADFDQCVTVSLGTVTVSLRYLFRDQCVLSRLSGVGWLCTREAHTHLLSSAAPSKALVQ